LILPTISQCAGAGGLVEAGCACASVIVARQPVLSPARRRSAPHNKSSRPDPRPFFRRGNRTGRRLLDRKTVRQREAAHAGRISLRHGGKSRSLFDAKDISPEALVAALEKHRVADRTVVYQGVKYLQKLRALNPRVSLLPPLNDLTQLESIDAELHPYAVDTRWEILSKELIDRCHSKGILVFSDSLGGHEKIEDYEKAKIAKCANRTGARTPRR
jgi:hypothetical protein